MILSWLWTGMLALSILFAWRTGHGAALSAALTQGAQAGITLAISLAGSMCLWSGVGAVMERSGLTALLGKLLGPVLRHLFPTSRKDPVLQGHLTANICANLLGLGNAATPMGIQAARRLRDPARPQVATNELCRLVVLNTASIQLIPANVAAVRASLGCASPFDILPAVWVTSLCAAGVGLAAAWLLGKVWGHD